MFGTALRFRKSDIVLQQDVHRHTHTRKKQNNKQNKKSPQKTMQLPIHKFLFK